MARRALCVDTAAVLTTRFMKMVACSAPIQQTGMGPCAPPQLAADVSQAGGLDTVAARLGGVVDPFTLSDLMADVRAVPVPVLAAGRIGNGTPHGSRAGGRLGHLQQKGRAECNLTKQIGAPTWLAP